MPWPRDNLTTNGLGTRDHPRTGRPALLRLIEAINAIIGSLGVSNGICDLDSAGRVPNDRQGRGQPNGAVPLDDNGKVPTEYILTDVYDSVGRAAMPGREGRSTASLDADGRIKPSVAGLGVNKYLLKVAPGETINLDHLNPFVITKNTVPGSTTINWVSDVEITVVSSGTGKMLTGIGATGASLVDDPNQTDARLGKLTLQVSVTRGSPPS